MRTKEPIPANAWHHSTVTYDGSSHAAGVQLYVNGQAADLEVVRDRLTREIVHRDEWGDADAGSLQLALGARFRDVGFKHGAVATNCRSTTDSSRPWKQPRSLASRSRPIRQLV